MPPSAKKAKSTKPKAEPKPKTPAKSKVEKKPEPPALSPLNSLLQAEIARLAETHSVTASVLEDFARFVIDNYQKPVGPEPQPDPVSPPEKIKPLTLPQLKAAVYNHFSVKDTAALKKSGAFKMATDGMDKLNLSVKEGWETLYRKFIGILPGEENQQGYGCINGINVFNYFQPWQVFGLDSQTATEQDIKDAYRRLSKIYHPDVAETGDAAIFDCVTTMYKSLSARA